MGSQDIAGQTFTLWIYLNETSICVSLSVSGSKYLHLGLYLDLNRVGSGPNQKHCKFHILDMLQMCTQRCLFLIVIIHFFHLFWPAVYYYEWIWFYSISQNVHKLSA